MTEENSNCEISDYVDGNITLQSGECIDIQITYIWFDSGKSEQPKLNCGTATMKYDITLGFTQATNE